MEADAAGVARSALSRPRMNVFVMMNVVHLEVATIYFASVFDSLQDVQVQPR